MTAFQLADVAGEDDPAPLHVAGMHINQNPRGTQQGATHRRSPHHRRSGPHMVDMTAKHRAPDTTAPEPTTKLHRISRLARTAVHWCGPLLLRVLADHLWPHP